MLGQTNAIIQGPRTNKGTIGKMMAHLLDCGAAEAFVINYRKAGDPFVNNLRVWASPAHSPAFYVARLREVDVPATLSTLDWAGLHQGPLFDVRADPDASTAGWSTPDTTGAYDQLDHRSDTSD